MWNKKRSLSLSRVCVLVFIGATLAILVAGPWLVDWLAGTRAEAQAGIPGYSTTADPADRGLFFATLYTGGAVALYLLVQLYRLLNNIAAEKVFTDSNVTLLRRISWCCFLGALVSGLSVLYYMPWGLVAVAAAFMALVVRVIKNVMAEAVVIKQENDYTI